MNGNRLCTLGVLTIAVTFSAIRPAAAATPGATETPLTAEQRDRQFSARRYQPQPTPTRYNLEKDEVEHLKSVLQPSPRLPGGEHAYYGNRLSRWSYIGPAGQGGYYEDLERYQRSLKLNPRNYRYRFR